MPLSDHEQRLLEQMERALYAEDPKFATTMRGADLRRRYRRRAVHFAPRYSPMSKSPDISSPDTFPAKVNDSESPVCP